MARICWVATSSCDCSAYADQPVRRVLAAAIAFLIGVPTAASPSAAVSTGHDAHHRRALCAPSMLRRHPAQSLRTELLLLVALVRYPGWTRRGCTGAGVAGEPRRLWKRRAAGLSTGRVIDRHVVPNIVGTIVACAALTVPSVILARHLQFSVSAFTTRTLVGRSGGETSPRCQSVRCCLSPAAHRAHDHHAQHVGWGTARHVEPTTTGR